MQLVFFLKPRLTLHSFPNTFNIHFTSHCCLFSLSLSQQVCVRKLTTASSLFLMWHRCENWLTYMSLITSVVLTPNMVTSCSKEPKQEFPRVLTLLTHSVTLTDRQTDTQTDTKTDRHADRHANTQTDTKTDTQTHTHTDKHTDRYGSVSAENNGYYEKRDTAHKSVTPEKMIVWHPRYRKGDAAALPADNGWNSVLCHIQCVIWILFYI